MSLRDRRGRAFDCSTIYVTDSETGVSGTYYNGFTSTFCSPSSGVTPA
jgi:hypothetical protein